MLIRCLLTACLLFSLNACGHESKGSFSAGTGQPATPESVDLFTRGEDGYHTYRIPALIASTKGTLLAFCEGRKNSAADNGDIDLLLKRSLDQGRTWENHQVVWEDGNNTIGNPSPVVDWDTGTIWLLFCKNNNRVLVTRSEDEGATWSAPEDITDRVKLPCWGWYATGPGHGIQLSKGRLLIPCDHSALFSRFSHVIFSDDHGATWHLGGITDPKMDECMAVELADGSIYLNMRNNQFSNQRAYSLSTDSGETWSPSQGVPELIGPVCQASIIRLTTQENHGRNRILFLNPASTKRENLTLRISYDETETWPVSKQLHEGPAAYSDLAVLPDTTVATLYENGEARLYEKITFSRLSVNWIENE